MQTNTFLSLQVIECAPVTDMIMRLKLAPADGAELPVFTAGAHVDVRINDEFTRAYSLCGDPAERGYYEIAVKREDAGRGGSKALHQLAHIGAWFEVGVPRNLFALAETAEHHLLVGAGVGLTPMLAMAHELSGQNKPFTLLVCTDDPASTPFLEQIEAAGWPLELCVDPRHNLDMTSGLAALPAATHVYCCGPAGLMDLVRNQCSALAPEQWHEEAFSAEVEAAEQPYDLYLSQSDLHLHVPAGGSMLTALREAGIHVESACEQGICGSCVVAWKDGEPEHRDQCMDDEDRSEYVAVCCGSCHSKSLTLDL